VIHLNERVSIIGCDRLMKCKVQGVYRNIRYRVLSFGEERYILDMGG